MQFAIKHERSSARQLHTNMHVYGLASGQVHVRRVDLLAHIALALYTRWVLPFRRSVLYPSKLIATVV